MEINEQSIFEALGVSAPENTSTADQAPETESGGDNAGTAEKSTETTPAQNATATAETDDIAEDAAEENDSDALSVQQRHENAARRRREEQQQAIDEALQQERERARQEWTSFFSKAGLRNTLTNKPINTLEDFNEWYEAFEQAKLSRELQEGKLTQEGLNKAISEHPAVKKMQESLDRERDTARQNNEAAARAKIDAELKEIHEMDPSINGVEDLLKMPNAKEFSEYVRKGNNFIDAYYLANRERLAEKTAQAAKQQAMNAARSKDHLNATGNARGAGAASVPAEEMELFRLFNPTASEAEIQAYYNKSRKEK